MSVKQVQAIVNGQTYTLTFNSNTGKYEATITAPSKSSWIWNYATDQRLRGGIKCGRIN